MNATADPARRSGTAPGAPAAQSPARPSAQPSARPSPEPARRRPGECRPASLAAELRVSLMRTVRRLRAEKSDQDLSDSQLSVLSVLDRQGPMTPGELAEFERVQPPSMTRTVAALAERGLVTRAAHPVDRRQVVITLSPSGTGVVRETRRRRDAWLARRLAELTPREREVLAEASTILRRIATA
ncbi:MAG TPA: MarR family transcriptional regulator [Kineosporiaceae bacterium]|nr:MarR family transcriptional regulator [Kineosporiaceae bacterium]